MEKVLSFLKEVGVFYFGTDDNGQVEIRPFGFAMGFEGKMYFGMGDHKSVYKQLKQNPKFSVCAYNGDRWLRLRGVASLEASEAAYKKAHEEQPMLAQWYNDQNKLQFALVEAHNVVVEFHTHGGLQETYSL